MKDQRLKPNNENPSPCKIGILYTSEQHFRKRKLITQISDIKQLQVVNLHIFCVNGEHFLTSCSMFGTQVKSGSDVERRTHETSSITIILRKIGYAAKKLFVSRLVRKYSAGLTLKIPLKTLFLTVSNFSVRFFT